MYLYRFLKCVLGFIFRIMYRVDVKGKENIPTGRGFILCSNHAHNFDPILVSIAMPGDIYWMGKKELVSVPVIGWIVKKLNMVPVDRDTVELSTIKTSLRVLKDGNTLGIFPEGTRVKEMDIENAKPGVALISTKAKAPILPIFIEGNYKIFSKMFVKIGKPIEFEDKYGTKPTNEEYKEMGQRVLKEIYSLKDN